VERQRLARVPSSGKYRDVNGVPQPRTFTARPKPGCSRPVTRVDFTHNEARLVDIARETQSLVSRLERVYGRQVAVTIAANTRPVNKPCNEAPTALNRQASDVSELFAIKCSRPRT
jgi:hypothetical protein